MTTITTQEQAALTSAEQQQPELLALDLIRRDGGTQARAGLNEETVQDYVHAIQNFAHFPPVVVYFDGTDTWLADGFHRCEAYKQTGRLSIPAEIRQGTRRDAILHAAGANAVHGLRRTNADKRRAVETLLRDEEWSKWSDREIARQCAVSQPFVGSLRKEHASDNDYQIERRVERNGKTYTMDTSNLGKKQPEPEPAAAEEQPEPEIPAEAIAWAEEVLGVNQPPVEPPELPPGWYFQDSSNPNDIIAINRNNHEQTSGFCDTYVQAAARAWRIHQSSQQPEPAAEESAAAEEEYIPEEAIEWAEEVLGVNQQPVEPPELPPGWYFQDSSNPDDIIAINRNNHAQTTGFCDTYVLAAVRAWLIHVADRPEPAPQGNPTGADVDIGIAPGAKVALRTVIGIFLKATQEPEGIRAWVRWPSGIVESVDPNILVVQEPEPEPEPDLPEQQPVAHPTIKQCMIDAYKLIKAGDTHRAKLQALRFRAHPDVAGIIGHAIWGMQQAMEGEGDGE